MNRQWIEGEHYYYNREGLIVLTEKFHLDRGYCCGNGCKHCPFNFINVKEPRRSDLRASADTDKTNNRKQ